MRLIRGQAWGFSSLRGGWGGVGGEEVVGAPGILWGGRGFLGCCWPSCLVLLEGSALWTWDKAGCPVHLQGRPQDEKGQGT